MGLLMLLAVAIRLTRIPYRWNQITLAYATYFAGYYRLFRDGDLWGCLTQFVGAHPPLYSALFSTLQVLCPRPLAWMGMSLAFAVATLPALVRLGSLFLSPWAAAAAGLLLAVSAQHTLYSLEVNNYPLLVLMGVLGHLAFARAFLVPEPRRIVWWILATTAAMYTHFLAITLLLAQGATLLLWRRDRLARFAAAALGVVLLSLPLAGAVLRNSQGEGYINAPIPLLEVPRRVGPGLWSHFGPPWVHGIWGLLAPLGVWRLYTDRRGIGRYLLTFLGISAAFLVFLLSRGVAAAHQYPYYLHLLPAWWLVLAAGLDALGNLLPQGLGAARALGGALFVVALAGRLAWFATTASAAGPVLEGAHLTHPSVAALAPRLRPGEAVFLVAPPRFSDDDKDRIDPAYWLMLLPPWAEWRFAEPPGLSAFEPVDPYWGNPFSVGGGTMYTFTAVDAARWGPLLDAHLRAGQPVWICAYDLAVAPGNRYLIDDVLADYRVDGRQDRGTGLLARVVGRRESLPNPDAPADPGAGGTMAP